MTQERVEYLNWLENLKEGDTVYVSVLPLSHESKRKYKELYRKETIVKITPKKKLINLSDGSTFGVDGLIIRPKTGYAVNKFYHADPNIRIHPVSNHIEGHMERVSIEKEVHELMNKLNYNLHSLSNEQLQSLCSTLKNL